MDSTRSQLQRTMSLTDVHTSSAIQDAIERDLTVPADRSKHRFFLQLPRHDFILPSLTRFDQDFRKFLLSALVDFPLKQELEDRRCLNWCSILPNFLPLQTLGDGNCLMHAVSLCMWAVQDRRLTLRKSVYQVLIEDQTDMLRKRWQLEQEKRLEEQHGSSVDCSNEQWNEDWKKTVDLASMTKSSETHSLNALEEIHIFTLANILRRPIFVLCDDVHRGNYDESLADVNLGGIYLPLLCDSVDCIKSPLVIGYHQGHFMALVTTEDGSTTGEDMMGQRRNKIAIPLMKYDNSTMKLHFLLPEEQQCSDRLLREYLNCSKVEYTNNEITRTILVATMQSQEPEAHLNQMCKTYFKALQEVYLEKLTERQLYMYGEQPHSSVMQTGNQHYGMKYHAPETAISPAIKTSSRCCSAHKKCKNAVCENYTTQDYCHQCRKSKPLLCTSPGCTYTANPNCEGLCSVCFARFRAILAQDLPHMVAPSAPPSNMCSTRDCQKQACPQFHGKCHDCFLKYIHDPNFGNNTFASSEPTDEPRKSRERHEPHSALSRQNSRLFCFSQRCKNLLQNSEQIYCEQCLACVPPELKTHLQAAISRNIDICCVFGCDLPAVTYHGQLCYQHYEESQGRHQNDDHVAAPQMTTRSQEATRCITSGCKFFGVPDHNYLCSRCHAKALQEQYDEEKIKAEQERAQAEWIAKLARRRAEQCQFDFYGCNATPKPFYHEVISAPTTTSSAPPSPNQRKTASDTVPCATKGCPHLGFKHTEGLCEVCYKKEEMLLYQGMSKRDRFSSLP